MDNVVQIVENAYKFVRRRLEELLEKMSQLRKFINGYKIRLVPGEPMAVSQSAVEKPLMQAKFVEMLLRKLKANGIHPAIETSGYASWEDFSAVARWCDVIHMDLKILDSEKHQNYVGCDNQLILKT